MALERVEIDDNSQLSRLVDEACKSHEPIVLTRDGREVAKVVPTERKTRLTPEERERWLSTAGVWRDDDFDPDAFLAYIYERRDNSSRPPVHL